MKGKFKLWQLNNSTNINKTNNHDHHNSLFNIKKTTGYDVGIPGPCLGQTQKNGKVIVLVSGTNDYWKVLTIHAQIII